MSDKLLSETAKGKHSSSKVKKDVRSKKLKEASAKMMKCKKK